jgi:thiol-disulfide isomerase/thioredoxin
MRFTVPALIVAALMTAAVPAIAQEKSDKPAEKAPAKATSLSVGDAAPALSIAKWIKGAPVTSFEKDKVYVVEFWATWCGPCIASMPHLSALQKEFKDKVTIIGVTSQDKNGNTLEKAEKMVADKGDTMGYTVAWDNEVATKTAFMRASGQSGIPCAFVIDKAGKVAYIGHPMFLDMVLGKVVDGKWDVKAGNAEIEKVQKELSGLGREAAEDPAAALKTFGELETKYPALVADLGTVKYDLLVRTGDAPAAHKLGMQMVDGAIKEKNAMKLNEIAWSIVDPEANVKNKDLELALKAADEAVKLSPKDAAILDTLARVYWVKGDKAKAIETETKAVENAPESQKDDLEATLKEYKSGK